jgi:hypothetical protein
MRTVQDALDAVDRRIAACACGYGDDDMVCADDDGLVLTGTGDELLPLLAGTDVDGRALMEQVHQDTLTMVSRLALTRGDPFPVIGGGLLSMFLLGWEFGRAAAEAERPSNG